MKHDLCRLQGTGCDLKAGPWVPAHPRDSVLHLCKPSSCHSISAGIGQGVMPTGHQTQEMASLLLKNPRLPRALQPAGQPLPTQAGDTQQHKPMASQGRVRMPWAPRDLGTQSQGTTWARRLVHLGECSSHTPVPCRRWRLLEGNRYKMYTYFL